MEELRNRIVSYREEIQIREEILIKRLDSLLPKLMKECDIDTWIVSAREYNEDPVLMTLLPARMLSARRRTILVFHLKDEISRYSLSRPGTGIDNFYEGVWRNPIDRSWGDDNYPEETQLECLSSLIKKLNPNKIGLNVSKDIALADGLSHSEYEQITKYLPNKIVSAEKLCVRWLEERIQEEIEMYDDIVNIAHTIIGKAFSNEVIKPGTTNHDVKFWMMDTVKKLGMEPWFDYEVSIVREGEKTIYSESTIRNGDMLHCDVGLKYLGLCTDTQHNAFIGKIPKGIADAQSKMNRLQDIVVGNIKLGKTGNEILKESREIAISEGLVPCIYTHPIGTHGHGAGVTIGLWDMQGGVPVKGEFTINDNTIYSLELNVMVKIPEWNNQEIMVGGETDIVVTNGEVRFVDIRQTKMYEVGEIDEL